jgi:hypothetical protein
MRYYDTTSFDLQEVVINEIMSIDIDAPKSCPPRDNTEPSLTPRPLGPRALVPLRS